MPSNVDGLKGFVDKYNFVRACVSVVGPDRV